jgi:hypothetical protein
MTTILADTFTASLARLGNDEQKQAKLAAFDLQTNPDNPGLQFHRIDKSRDPNFWSVRVNRDLRIVVHKSRGSLMLAYVGHHDDAYDWAGRRVIAAHPSTGVIQIREVRELVENITPRSDSAVLPLEESRKAAPSAPVNHPFTSLSAQQLLSIGVPSDWIADVLAATDDSYFALHDHLPPEAGEALLNYAATGLLSLTPSSAADPLAHPDTQRRFRVLDGVEELRAALDAPFEKWATFLHPSQRALVERHFNGPARVVGSAGTGKTVVALHRVVRLLKADPEARILLATFSRPLAHNLRHKLDQLLGENELWHKKVSVLSFDDVAAELYALVNGGKPSFVRDEELAQLLLRAAEEAEVTEVTEQFLLSEWVNVIDPWQIDSAEAYANVPRVGRKGRLGPRQRERLWRVFDLVRRRIAERSRLTRPGIFMALANHYRERETKPFTNIIVDEAQDLGVAELRFLATIASPTPDSMFFAGDIGQRIFRQPFSWKALGVDVRGRSATLRVNYRTSHQIRRAADHLMPESVRDLDGLEDGRAGTISVFDGPEPEVVLEADIKLESAAVAERIRQALADGYTPGDIGIFVRTESLLPRARAAATAAGLAFGSFAEREADDMEAALLGTMHLAKGLEFRMVVVMACDQDVLPLASRVEQVADDFELDEVLATERQLLYVAVTRARDRLIVSATTPGSEFLENLSTSD